MESTITVQNQIVFTATNVLLLLGNIMTITHNYHSMQVPLEMLRQTGLNFRSTNINCNFIELT